MAWGDILLVPSGKVIGYRRGDETYFAAHAGVGAAAAVDLYERGIALLGTDTTANGAAPDAQ